MFAEAECHDRFSRALYPSPVNHELAKVLRFDLLDPVDILPVCLRDRVVAYVLGLKIKTYSRVSLADLRVAVAIAGTALERLLRQRKLRG